MQRRYENVRQQEFMKAPVQNAYMQYQTGLLIEQVEQLIAKWPKYGMHDVSKCYVPEHLDAKFKCWIYHLNLKFQMLTMVTVLC